MSQAGDTLDLVLNRPVLVPPPLEVEAIRAELLECGVPTVEVHSLRRGVSRSRLGRDKLIHEPIPGGRVWLLGELMWTYSIRHRDGGGERTGPVLTALAEVEPEYSMHRGFSRVRVDRENGGYLTLGGWATLCSWGEVINRVEQMTSPPNSEPPAARGAKERRRQPTAWTGPGAPATS